MEICIEKLHVVPVYGTYLSNWRLFTQVVISETKVSLSLFQDLRNSENCVCHCLTVFEHVAIKTFDIEFGI